MKKIYFYASAFLLVGMVSCSSSEHETHEAEDQNTTEQEEIVEEEAIEEEQVVELSDFIKGNWVKIAQGCDEEGNNCQETKGSDWIFDGEKVMLGRIEQPYHISNDTIYIVDSPYRIAKEWGDTILLNGIAQNRYMKLVRKTME